MTKSRRGLSRGHKVSYATGVSKSIPLNKTSAQLKRKKDQFRDHIASLSFLQRDELFGSGAYDVPMPDAPTYHSADIDSDDDGYVVDSDDAEAFQRPPAGEEGMHHSHAGKEAVFDQIWQKCRPGRGDSRRRAMRVQNMVNAWKNQMPALVDAYLRMKQEGPLSSDDAADTWRIEVIGFEVEIILENGFRQFAHTENACETNESLMRHGYIGASPERVSLAFPIRTFEIFRQVHRVCPRYSLDALSKTLMNLHHTSHRSTLAEQLTASYDAFLEVMRQADMRVHTALGRDSTWYSKNICPALFIQNDSTFRAGNSTCIKTRVADAQKRARKKGKAASTPTATIPVSPPSATPSTVPLVAADIELPDVNATERSEEDTPAPYPSDLQEDDGDIAWLNVNELSAQETDELVKCLNTCVERWKAAGPEARKKMFALFAIAGIFLSVCRHGHVLVMCDMIRSGELMKYPLAIVKKLLDEYGADICLGYDIMCAFFKTLSRSSLGANVTALRLHGVVPAFHGHAHNRTCQIGWHPLYVDGVGCEDFEECERTFSKSNNLASITRTQTAFHRQQTIDEHFQYHDQDKHAASGNFIYQNYRQALEKIATNRGQLSVMEAQLGTTAEDYEAYHAAEVKYFAERCVEPPEVQQKCDYMDLLVKLHVAEQDADQAKRDYAHRDHLIIREGYTGKQITAIDTRYRTTWTKYIAIEETVCRFEEEHLIVERWTTSSEEYQAALGLMNERKYRTALAELERLVVSRLFELTKLNMSGVGYKLREKISKALKTRADAIRRALSAYNAAAGSLQPPREQLQWADVITKTSLAEFDLLRDTDADIHSEPWAQPARREAMVLYFGIKRAKEEICRLNVEIRRLITFMLDEHVDFYRAVASTINVNPPLARELSGRWEHACAISTTICRRLVQTSKLQGFSGSLFPGAREGRDPELGTSIRAPRWLGGILGITQAVVEYEEPDSDGGVVYDDEDLLVRELDIDEDGLADLMDHLSTFDDT
ncbi:hypothetical protein B0H14DRAFT_3681713 [Mycena olivaceomarginata]|nr:hypothetical protein B0H14DRAFT_3681713 [Mycena olivaceomarginata]